jgi:hypothetical protein
MGLAGNMKRKTFLMLVTGVSFVGAGAVYLGTSDSPIPGDGSEVTMESVEGDPPPPPGNGSEVRSGVILKRPLTETGLNSSPISPSLPPVVAPDAGALRPEPSESMVLAWKQRPIAVPKKKDVSKGRPFKINVYQDDPGAGVGRAKVDLDRDDQWDHKYTFEPDGGVTRKVSPNDDENYTVVQRLADEGWITQE